MSATHRARPHRQRLKLLAGTAVVALIAGGSAFLSPLAASAAGTPFAATDLIATTSGAADIVTIDRATGAATNILSVPGTRNGTYNQLGISGDGTKLFLTDSSTLRVYSTETEAWLSPVTRLATPAAVTMGGVDPKTQRYFYGGRLGTTGSSFTFRSYDPTTGTFAPDLVSVTTPTTPPGGNGDLAFDRQGNMYFIASNNAAGSVNDAQLFRVNAADLNGGSATAAPVGDVIKNTPSLNSLAFGDDGYLYIAGSGNNGFLRVNPVTGVIVGTQTVKRDGTNLNITDLGSRAVPSTGQAQSGFTDGRAKPGDELTVSITGGGISKNNTGTTASPGDTATAGPLILLPGESYTVVQTPGNAGTDPAAYDTSYQCVNLVDNSVVFEGKGTSAPFTVPASGADVSCSFSNPLKPTVENTSSTGNTPGEPATVDVLRGAVGDIDPTTVTLTAPSDNPDAVLSDNGKTLTVPGQGVWTVNPDNGNVTFTPEPGFTKNPTPVTYTVQDTRGNQTQGQASVTYLGSAQNDTARTDQGAAVPINVLNNDQGGVDASSVVFPTAGQPDGVSVTDGGKTLTVPGEGVYSVDPSTGVVTFTPEPAFRGTASPVIYQVADADGSTSTATVTVTVAPVGPATAADTDKTQQNTPVTVDVLDNDTAGVTGGTPIDPKSVVFPTAGQPDGATVTDGGKTLTVPGEGVYTVNPTTGAVTFTPAQGYTGTATPITYQVSDTGGQTSTGQLTVSVTAVTPTANPDTATIRQGGTTTIDVLDGDTAGNKATPLDPASVVFPTTGQPDGATVSDGGKKLTVPGEGVYTIDPDNGDVTFTADPTFRGTATPVTYQVADVDGATSVSTVTVTVTPVAPAAKNDTDKTQQNTPVTVDVLDNDTAGVTGGTPIDPKSVVFPTAGQPDGATVTDGGKTLTVPGEGVYTVNPTTGAVTFTPAQGYTGTATPITYQVSDTGGQTATATLTIAVTAVTPTANNDTAKTARNTPVTVQVLGNDTPGNPGTPIDATKTRLLDTNGQPVTELTVPGEGVFSVDAATGAITFTPVKGYSGTVAVPYRITDVDGGTSDAVLTVVVGTPPTATNDAKTGTPGTAVTVDVLGNDHPGSTPIDPSSVRLVDPQTGELVTTVTVPNEGTYVVNPDGTITFTPVAGFSGKSAVDYSVAGEDGSRATATLTVTIPSVAGITPNPVDGGGIVVTTPGGKQLAFTGTDLAWQGSLLAVLLLGAGIGITVLRRRRSTNGN